MTGIGVRGRLEKWHACSSRIRSCIAQYELYCELSLPPRDNHVRDIGKFWESYFLLENSGTFERETRPGR